MKKLFYYSLMLLFSFSYAQKEKDEPPRDTELEPSWKNCIMEQDDSNFFVGGRYSIGSPFTNSYMSVVNNNISDNFSLTASQEFSLNAGVPEVFAVERYYKYTAPIIYRYVGGRFTRYGGTVVNGFMRIKTDGSLDPSFVLNNNNSTATVRSIVLQADDRIVLGGNFNSYFGQPRGKVVRLNPDGTLDVSFATTGNGFDGEVYCVKVQSDGKIIVGGDFDSYDGIPRPKIARLNSDGTLDETFYIDFEIDKKVRTILIQEDGNIVIGGNFTASKCALFEVTTGNCVSSYNRNRIARLKSNGSLDETFLSVEGAESGDFGFNRANISNVNVAEVYTIVHYTEGRLFVGGNFDMYVNDNEFPRNNICLLNVDGSLSDSFNTILGGPDLTVRGSTVEENENVVIVGVFRNFNNDDANGIVRVAPSGLAARISNENATEPTSIKSFKSDIEDKTISITPNPVTNIITVSSKETFNAIQMMDINGRIINNQTFDNISIIEMNVSDLAKGMYIMNIVSKDGNLIQKFLKN